MEKKQHLINSLKIAINALRNDIIHYDWANQSSCNAGIVSQAVLGKNSEEINKLSKSLFKKIKDMKKEDPNLRIQATWKNAVKYSCSMTGKNMPEIVQDLQNAGISREDIVHLEYLENPAILALSGIERNKKIIDVEIDGEYEMVDIPHENRFLAFFGFKQKKNMYVPKYERQVVDGEYPAEYYAKKENLIKYLVAWVSILEGETNNLEQDVEKLEAKLLVAVAEENYEEAGCLRDKIANLSCN